MDTITLTHVFSLFLGCCVGVTAHIGVFIHGEWHVQAPRLIIGHFWGLLSLALIWLVSRESNSETHKLWIDFFVWASLAYLPALFSSILVYRVSSFHRLTTTAFPGPFGARVSKLWHVWHCRSSKNHEILDRLYQEYGDFVRTGEP